MDVAQSEHLLLTYKASHASNRLSFLPSQMKVVDKLQGFSCTQFHVDRLDKLAEKLGLLVGFDGVSQNRVPFPCEEIEAEES